jgi:DNA recombination protein RmuC
MPDSLLPELQGERLALVAGAALVGLFLGALIAWLAGRASRARLAAELGAERRSTVEKVRLLGETEVRLREAFQALSAEALRQNNESFLALAQTRLGQVREQTAAELDARQQAIEALVKPVRETLVRVDEQIRRVEKERHGHYDAITQHLHLIAESHERLRAETTNLVKALRQPTARGRWGELQLRRVCEMAGMLAHCDFAEQETTRDAEGAAFRPDLIVRLPGEKQLVVDAKAPLDAYLEALEAADDETRRVHLRRHAANVKTHMSKLGSKAYWQQFDAAPEFVVMFLPGEAFFSAALQHEPALIEHGVAERVIVASPTTLIALLRAAAYGWQQERIAANAEEISRLGRELYERIGNLAGHFARVGRELDAAVAAYNGAIGSLEGRVLVTARRFRELGVGGGDEIDRLEGVQRNTRATRGEV